MTAARAEKDALAEQVRAFAAEDPDPGDRAELETLLVRSAHSESDYRELADRFRDRLHFGTAGLRGAVAAGPNRMNRAVVRWTTAALCRWLADHSPEAGSAGVVVCCDARHRSPELADEATAVLAGAGILVHRLADRQPTPLLAFAVRHVGAAAGVMITASHNPPGDNGYKLYLGDGAQIVPPVDSEIETLIDQSPPLSRIPLGELHGPLVRHCGPEVAGAYVRAVLRAAREAREAREARPAPPLPAGRSHLKVVYTPLHGVAGPLFFETVSAAGLPSPLVVPAQALPDPGFPTVAFPNPEEPGALDLAFDLARQESADLVLANDPDGDRMAVAVPDEAAEAGWRRLSGDEVGALLGDYVISRTSGADRLVAASIVSSRLLEKIARSAGVKFVATLTGFKWIVRAATAVPGSRFVFGYEEALGYAVNTVVRDKDGISASLAFLDLVELLSARGSSVLDRLDELCTSHGVHLTRQQSMRCQDPASLMASLRADPPKAIAGEQVVSVVDLRDGAVWQEGLPALPPADVLCYGLGSGARLIVRPSGTEAKLKSYLEVTNPPPTPAGLAEARLAATVEMGRLGEAVEDLLGVRR